MWFVFDIIIAIIFIVFAITGIKKGFIKSICGVGITVLSIILALNLKGPLAEYFRSTVVYEQLTDNLNEKIQGYVADSMNEGGLGELFEEAPAGLSAILSGFGTNTDEVAEKYREMISAGEENISAKIYDYIVEPAAQTLSDVLAILAVFLAAIIILNIAVKILDLIFKLPVLNFANKVGGFAVGIVMALLVSFVFCTAVNLATPYLPGIGINIDSTDLAKAPIFSALSEINPLSFIYR